jgi:hypothetical protein
LIRQAIELSIWGSLSPVTSVSVGPQSAAEADEVATIVQAAARAMTLRIFLDLDTCAASSAQHVPARGPRILGRMSFSSDPPGVDQ